MTGNLHVVPLLRRWTRSTRVAWRVLIAWLAGNLFLGSQISWLLRPFIWDPEGPVRFIGHQYLRGSFYETVFEAARRLSLSMNMHPMTLLNMAGRRGMIAPLLVLIAASGVSVSLVVAHIVWTENLRYAFLVWNLFLAWLPLYFALHACEERPPGRGRSWRVTALAGAWLFFLPNSPYIFTDLIHLQGHFQRHYWVDLVLVLTCAMTGLTVGCVSLYLMQSRVARMCGRIAGWVFVAAAAALSGVGICIGRFLRFNTWDIVFQPVQLYHSLGAWASEWLASPSSAVLPVLFGAFFFTAYLLLYALTHLPPHPAARSGGPCEVAERFPEGS